MEQLTWMVARAGGFTSYVLLAGAVIIGLALSLHWLGTRWPRLINSELHNHLTILSLVFLAVHVVAVLIDPYTAFSPLEVLVPFVSAYRTLWMGLGIVALYLGMAIGLSTWLRPRIGYALWRKLHTLTLGIFALATVHGVFTGTDSGDLWAWAIYGASVSLVGILFVLRLARSAEENQKRAAKRQVAQVMQPHV
jgi:predicted ferric reductase